MSDVPALVRAAVATRRTFAIISHPDAGKTTLTEKLLLYGGAIHLAGSINQRGETRRTTSDWMEIERQRGISITTSVLQFLYRGRRVNLLDTPGHNDFSEDTYRTLAAADSAVMLIDSVKGVEPQTVKLFKVCRMRRIPLITFINKMDRHGRDPLDLLDEIERVLGVPTSPLNWPIGAGPGFQGVCDRTSRQLLRFHRAEGGAVHIPVEEVGLDDPGAPALIGERAYKQLRDELDLLDTAGNAFDRDAFLRGEVTPVFFGSAMTNFGVEPFLERFVDLAPSPPPRETTLGPLPADDPRFSGFVFKIQANMDRDHRDRIAFLRICSGRFTRGMEVRHARLDKLINLNRPLQFLAQERTVVEEAFSGDIIGLWDPGILRIGDTLCEGPAFELPAVPRFSPEHFVRVRLADPLRRKQLKKGLEQLSEEGVVQLFFDRARMERDPILGAVGVLQFDVIQHRLQSEYGVSAIFDRLPYQHARWVEGEGFQPERFENQPRSMCLVDIEGRSLVLFQNEYLVRMAEDNYPKLRFIAAVQPGRA